MKIEPSVQVKIRKLKRPVPAAPNAIFIAHLVKCHVDGATYTEGAWYGTDRLELHNRVLAWDAR